MNQLFSRICTVIMIALLLCGVTYTAYTHDEAIERVRELAELGQEYVIEQETEEAYEEEVMPESTEPEIEDEPLVYCEQIIDFTGIQEENGDVYAWIQVPGTEINYPVLQKEEDNYYLSRNLDDSEGYPGSIYTNKCNAKDFSDAITVLYGHNMKNGTMFAGLHDFEDEEFFEENDIILIYTEDARYTYKIYMAAAYSDAYIPALFDVTSGAEAVRLCEELEIYSDRRKLIRDNMGITEEDSLLTLSTCIANEGTKRYVVVGKLIETAVFYE